MLQQLGLQYPRVFDCNKHTKYASWYIYLERICSEDKPSNSFQSFQAESICYVTVRTIVLSRHRRYRATLWIFWGPAEWTLRLRPLRFFYVQI